MLLLVPVSCFFDLKWRSGLSDPVDISVLHYNVIVTAITLLYLLLSYVTRMVQLYSSATDSFRGTLPSKLGPIFVRSSSACLRWIDKLTFYKMGPRFWFFFIESPLVALYYLVLHIVVLLLSSVLSDLSGLYFGCMIGLFKVILHKNRELDWTHSNPGDTIKVAGFGQLLPLLLLSGPIIAAVQAFRDSTADNKNNNNQQNAVTPILNRQADARQNSERWLPSLQDHKRWKRLGALALDEKHRLAAESPIAVFSVGIGLLYFFLAVFTWIATSNLRHSIGWLVPLLLPVQPLVCSALIAQVIVMTIGWKPKAFKRACWSVSIGTTMAYAISWILMVYEAAQLGQGLISFFQQSWTLTR